MKLNLISYHWFYSRKKNNVTIFLKWSNTTKQKSIFCIFQIQVTSISTMQIREKLRVLNYLVFVLCCVGNWLNLIQTKRPSSSRRRRQHHLYFVVCFIIFDDIMMRWRVVGSVVVSLIDIDVFTDFSKDALLSQKPKITTDCVQIS